MALEAKALETAVTGIVGIGVNVFGQFLEGKSLKPAKQQLYNWSERYVKNYLRRHGQIQILGMSQAISLDDIYTNVRMLDAETVKRLESVEGLEQLYRTANQRGFGKKASAKQKGIAIANTEQYLCVLGGPGIGKTTYLRKVGMEALLKKFGSYNHEKIPVFLELKRFRDPDLDIKESISEEFETCGFPNPEQFTEHALKMGNLLILLDGLDEVPSNNFNKVVQAIKDFSDRYSENRFISSCRIAAYNTYFTGFKTVAIAEFTDNQIFDFIKKWFQADPNPHLTPEKKAEYANTIWEQLKNSDSIGTKELSQTPLLLTFICLVFRQTKTITNNRAKLYSKALDILLDEWAKSKLLDENWEIYQDLCPEMEKDMLAEIAHFGFKKDKLFFEKDELAFLISTFLNDRLNAPKHLNSEAIIDEIAVQQGLFIERAMDVYSFSHLTLQEFLTAEYVVYNLENLVKNHATDYRWREVFLLVTGLRGRDAIELLEKLEVKTQELSEHPKVKGLLAWVKDKTSAEASDYSGEIKRVFNLILIINLANAQEYAHYHTPYRGLKSYITSNFTVAYYIERDLAHDSNFASTLDHLYERSRDRASIIKHAGDDTLDRARALDRAKFALDKQLITDVDLQPFISYLENSLEASNSSAKELTSIVSSSLDISPEFFDLSNDDVQAFTNYLSTCKLMIDCSKQASGLSAKDWNAIKQRMFLPPQSGTSIQ